MNHVLIGFPLLVPSSMPARTKFQSTLVSLDDNRITCPEGRGGLPCGLEGQEKTLDLIQNQGFLIRRRNNNYFKDEKNETPREGKKVGMREA